MRWTILNKNIEKDRIIETLLENRNVKSGKEKDEFINPILPDKLTAQDLGLEEEEVKKGVQRILSALENNERIIVYGDYDADGICATAILWKTLYKFNKNILPYIPERAKEGYGLNKESLSKLKKDYPDLKLIITVDHGITAAEKVDFAGELGVDIIVCDHHQINEKVPNCVSIIHTEKICAAAIAWFVSLSIEKAISHKLSAISSSDLDLVAIATIADMEPLIGVNRSFAKYGLEELNRTVKPGLLSLFEEARIVKGNLGSFEIGYIIAPRLNAMGRLSQAMDSLRLLCTSSLEQANMLASKLGLTNKERQEITEVTSKHARSLVLKEYPEKLPKLLFAADISYEEGVIGLAAGRLTEEFFRPSVVLAVKENLAKASARSIAGFNIIEAIRTCSDLLIDAGGHPMAAGFTIEISNINLLKERLIGKAEELITEEMLEKSLKIDFELPLEENNIQLYDEIQNLSPFGIGNPEPVFKSSAYIKEMRPVGSEGKHIKFVFKSENALFSGIAFNRKDLLEKLKIGDEVDVAYCLTLNEWQGRTNLELRVKDIK